MFPKESNQRTLPRQTAAFSSWSLQYAVMRCEFTLCWLHESQSHSQSRAATEIPCGPGFVIIYVYFFGSLCEGEFLIKSIKYSAIMQTGTKMRAKMSQQRSVIFGDLLRLQRMFWLYFKFKWTHWHWHGTLLLSLQFEFEWSSWNMSCQIWN